MGTPLLQVEAVVAGYGPTTVLNGLALQVQHGERLAVIGRNGVGKTTLLRTVMGLATLSRGRVLFDGQDLAGLDMITRDHRDRDDPAFEHRAYQRMVLPRDR